MQMPAMDTVIVHEKQDPILLTLVAKPGTGFEGKTALLNGVHLRNGVMKIKCQPRERESLKRYFGRSYQLFEPEPEESKASGPVQNDAAPFDHADAEVSSGVPEEPAQRSAKAPVAGKPRSAKPKSGDAELRADGD